MPIPPLRGYRLYQLLMLVVGLVGLLANRGSAQLPMIELHTISQSVAQIGTSFDLSLSGSRTDELRTVHFSSPFVTAVAASPSAPPTESATEANGIFKVAIAADAHPGPCDVRGQGRFGLSNPRRLWLTHRPVQTVTTDHAQQALAVELKAGTILFAHCQPQRRNHYQIHLAPEQSLHLAVYAQQLDSRATPIVVLNDASGRELARSRARGEWPAEINFRAPDAMNATVVVFDAIFQGGAEYPYALEFERVLPGQPASGLELDRLLGPELTNSNAADRAERATQLAGLFAVADSLQPTDSRSADSAAPPLHIEQVFSAERVPHRYDFSAAKDQQLTIDVRSHAVGQLTDPRLLLYHLLPAEADTNAPDAAATTSSAANPGTASVNQQQLLVQDDPAAVGDAGVRVHLRDPHVTWKAPADGLYRLEIQDNESGLRPSEQRAYRIEVRPPQPHFQLLAYPLYPTNQPGQSRPLGLTVMPGGTAAIRILAVRREGFEAAIEVAFDELPPGVQAAPVTIHSTQSEATMVISCSEAAAAWCGPLQLTGVAAGDPKQSHPAYAATINWAAVPTYNAVQARPCAQLWLAINPADTAPLTVALGSGTLLEVKAGEKLAVPVNITRRAGGTGACVLRPQNLLGKVTAAEVTIPADQTSGTCELTVAADAPPGEFSLWVQVETKVKWRDNPQALQRAETRLAELQADLAAASATNSSATEQQSSLTRTIETLTAQVEELKKLTAEKELTVFLPSTTQRIRILSP